MDHNLWLGIWKIDFISNLFPFLFLSDHTISTQPKYLYLTLSNIFGESRM